MAIRLTIRREGSLLSVIRDQELTDTQLQAIEVILDNERMAYNVVEDDRISTLLRSTYPWSGIEQFQAEDR
jgi:hypothetical protein